MLNLINQTNIRQFLPGAPPTDQQASTPSARREALKGEQAASAGSPRRADTPNLPTKIILTKIA